MKINEELFKEVSVLFVDDDPNILDNVSKFLNRRFAKVYIARNGKEGIEAFEQYRPDIVITDIQMPFMNGLGLARLIKGINPETPVIITTAYTEIPYLMEAIEIGIDGYISKPILNETLYETLRKNTLRFVYRKMMEAKNRLVQTVMDWNPNFSILISGENLNYINKYLLNFFGYKTMEEFFEHHECLQEFIVALGKEEERYKTSDKWFKQIIDNPEIQHKVYLKSIEGNDAVPYLVKFQYFKEIDQYLFAFIEIAQ